mmetsp:Transcript_9251/g.22735  ORF Transcript_9251/g.22735 Transcript_9251/m.22735 type:complete len:84 (-) Transcript_9251:480-731(-)|eukprot:CAMPEP_0114523202 /NCGR_PEP_ID=MMETSP0109-20121206/21166_1 /TAXON_ID=29199 /ORGANISM="Chlorarachnion reptans, Strain CCCM449" /LENGTH=83 /DNA_ID=CAMNT_0001704503 /DNA_START=43 /DNA_END=294 /DNA_ORIENTATION=-
MSRLRNVPSLKAFMMRGEVLRLYRSVVRVSKRLDPAEREATLEFARNQFKTMKSVNDTHHIRYLLMEGRKQLDQCKNSLDQAM